MSGGIKLTIHDLLRAQDVERWTIINKVRRQSVAEHQWMVACVAMHLYQDIMGDPPTEREMLTLVIAAMFHDAPESRTGDVPTPGKAIIKAQSRADIFRDIDLDLMPVLPFIGGVPSDEIRRYVDVADVLCDAAWIRENGIGEHARIIAGKTHTRLVQEVDEASRETGVDWYEPVNRVLMALGAPIIHHNSWIHKL